MKPVTPDELRVAGFVASKTFEDEQKDLDTYVLMARCVFDAALALAEQHPDEAAGYRSIAMNTSFNIAAACWPGWADAHADIDAEKLALALEMGEFNVRTGRDLDAPASRRFNGYWIHGVHQMASGDHEGARNSFEAAENCAELMDSDENRYMARGWLVANTILQLGGDAPDEELDGIVAKLKSLGEDGEFYAEQYAPALKNLSSAVAR